MRFTILESKEIQKINGGGVVGAVVGAVFGAGCGLAVGAVAAAVVAANGKSEEAGSVLVSCASKGFISGTLTGAFSPL